MAIHFHCRGCLIEIDAADEAAGRPIKCRRCGRLQVVPVPVPIIPAAPLEVAPLPAPPPLAPAPPGTTARPGQPNFASFHIRPAPGVGAARGKALWLRRRRLLEFGPLGLTIYGRRQRVGRMFGAALVALAITFIFSAVIAFLAPPRWLLFTAPTFFLFYAIAAAMLGRMDYEDLKMSKHGRAVHDDRRAWLSIEIYHDQWLSFVPVRGPWGWQPDRRAYKEIKARLETLAGPRLLPRR